MIFFPFCSAWINEMIAIINAEEVPKDLPGAEALVTRSKEHKAITTTTTPVSVCRIPSSYKQNVIF
jgi:hypothetical protein